jgi:hypothetical protein
MNISSLSNSRDDLSSIEDEDFVYEKPHQTYSQEDISTSSSNTSNSSNESNLETMIRMHPTLEQNLKELYEDVKNIRSTKYEPIRKKIESISKDVIDLQKVADTLNKLAASSKTDLVDVSTNEELKNGLTFLRDKGIITDVKNSYSKEEIIEIKANIYKKMVEFQKEVDSEMTLSNKTDQKWEEIEKFVMKLLEQLNSIISRIIQNFRSSSAH